MSRELPPLNALRAFEAAARLESYSAAAQELDVTHGAMARRAHQAVALDQRVEPVAVMFGEQRA